MYALSVTIYVENVAIAAFIAATEAQVRQTRQEVGNIHYEVRQSEENPGLFVIYEAYRSKEDFLVHRTSQYATDWKTATEPMLAQPRTAVRGTSLFASVGTATSPAIRYK